VDRLNHRWSIAVVEIGSAERVVLKQSQTAAGLAHVHDEDGIELR
jgi:hypothetical protein